MWSQNIHLISDRRKLHRATPDSYILKKDERRSRRKMTSRRFLAVVFHATHFGDLQLGRCERAVASLLGKTRLDFSPGATWFLKLDVRDFNGWCFFLVTWRTDKSWTCRFLKLQFEGLRPCFFSGILYCWGPFLSKPWCKETGGSLNLTKTSHNNDFWVRFVMIESQFWMVK